MDRKPPVTIDIPSLPYRGPCGLCGGPDARHRLCDLIRGQARAGVSPKMLAADFCIPIADARALAGATGQAYGGWLRRTRRGAMALLVPILAACAPSVAYLRGEHWGRTLSETEATGACLRAYQWDDGELARCLEGVGSARN